MSSHRFDMVTAMVDERQPACGSTKVVAIDGPSGSGKTTFARRLAEATGADVLHLDDVYPGWHGLQATPAMIVGALEDIAVGEVGTVNRWSWVRNRPGPLRHVPPSPLLILDGVVSGAGIIRPHLSLLVWLEAPVDVRRRRALSRDGETYEPYWDVWAEQERRLFAVEATRAHADVVVTS